MRILLQSCPTEVPLVALTVVRSRAVGTPADRARSETKAHFAISVPMGPACSRGAFLLNGVLPDFRDLALVQLGHLEEWKSP